MNEIWRFKKYYELSTDKYRYVMNVWIRNKRDTENIIAS
jgi:hypothetical protein